MTFGQLLYHLASSCLSFASSTVLSRRVKTGKEDPARLGERRARNLPARPDGTLVWLHGASVGESLMLLELGRQLLATQPGLQLLFTSQTQTSARLMATRLPGNARHQMAPLDTPAIARQFIAHWRPALAIFAEGEIWPNLLSAAESSGTKLALINARMTAKSLRRWARWPRTARAVFDKFDLIVAADTSTATGLSTFVADTVHAPGNLKSALPPPEADTGTLAEIRSGFLPGRPCFLAASTHAGEEALFLDAAQELDPRPALVIVPRHPERGAEIETQIRTRGLSVARRSRGEPATAATDVLLADTLGEMGLWYRLADVVYLGGGHADGIGGHNPLEPVRLGKPVFTGPAVYNFSDVTDVLASAGAVAFADSATDLATLARPYISGAATFEPDQEALTAFFATADAPMTETCAALERLLPGGDTA